MDKICEKALIGASTSVLQPVVRRLIHGLVRKLTRTLTLSAIAFTLCGSVRATAQVLPAPSTETAAVDGTAASAAGTSGGVETQRATGVARIVTGIIGFTRWPRQHADVRVCVVTPALYADQISSTPGSADFPGIRVQRFVLDDPRLATSCDAVYLELDDTPRGARLLRTLSTLPVLSISVGDKGCALGSLFCLSPANEPLSFSANLDAIARSGLQINPKVLLLAKTKGREK